MSRPHEAVWIDPIADTTVNCPDVPADIPDLFYSNGVTGACAIEGSVPGSVQSIELCEGAIVWEWVFTDDCNRQITHHRTIFINPPGPIVFIDPPTDTTVTCGNVPPAPVTIEFTNNSDGLCHISGNTPTIETGSVNYCGGEITRMWSIGDACGNQYEHVQIITVEPAPQAMFTSLPADVTIECSEVPPVPPSLEYSNGLGGQCGINGTVAPSVANNYNACGGTVTYTWNFTDLCDRTITHSQVLTVLPAPPPAFTNPPADVTLSCEEVPLDPPSLSYTNGSSGNCAITGTVVGVQSGSFDECGGNIAFQWSITDLCGNVINHIQQIEVTPAADPGWIDPPADVTLGCDDPYSDPPSLTITNGVDNPCLIEEIVAPIVELNGNIYTHTWEFIHPCSGDLIEHVQVVTIVPLVDIEIDPNQVTICEGESFDLSSIFVEDLNGSNITVTYHEFSPADNTNELPSAIVTPGSITEYYILGTNEYGCSDEESIVILVDPAPNAGNDNEFAVCQTDELNLNFLNPPGGDPGGYWYDPFGAGFDLSDPSDVPVGDIEPGFYTLQYVLEAPVCTADTADLTLQVVGPPEYAIDSVFCTGANDFYTVAISGNNLEFDFSVGDLVVIAPGIYQIQNIPINQTLSIDIWETGPYCGGPFTIQPPNCDCPSVPAPGDVPDQEICEGEPVPQLEIVPEAGTITHWYDAATGGNLLISDSPVYTPSVSSAGVYTYYVQAESIDFPGCVSAVRTPVTLIIHAPPAVNNITIAFCDTTETGMLDVDLSLYSGNITANTNNVVTFHSTQADAENGTAALGMPVVAPAGASTYYARVVSIAGCVSTATVEVTIHVLPNITADVTPPTCEGDSNAIIELSGYDPGGTYTVTLGNESGVNIWLFDDLAPGNYMLTVFDQNTLCNFTTDVVVPEGPSVDLSIISVDCDDNDTDTDPSDDFYIIQFSGSTSGPGTMYELFGDGSSLGTFTYDAMHSVQVPASGMSLLLEMIDAGSGCSDEATTINLVSCSSNCEITIEQFTQDCDDNGTPTDPTDDTYTIVLIATAVNGSSTNLYDVLFDGMVFNTYSYGVAANFTVNVSSAPSSIQLRDVDDAQCFINVVFDPFLGCSGACAILPPDVTYECDSNGTEDDATDDFYTIEFTPQVINPGASSSIDVLVDAVFEQSVPSSTTVTLTLPADGMTHLITLVDADIDSCNISWQTPVLTSCSTQCSIWVDVISYDCNDNGTPTDPLDDTYDIEFVPFAEFGSAGNSCSLSVDGTYLFDIPYEGNTIITLNADALAHDVVLVDTDDPTCTYSFVTNILVPCSDSCLLDAQVIEVMCNNNGTNQVDDDDFYEAVVLINGANAGMHWQSTDPPGLSGQLGIVDTLGPFLISDGNTTISIEADNPQCPVTFGIEAPLPCSSCEQSIDAGPDVFIDCGMPVAILTITSSHPGVFSWTDPQGNTSAGETIEASTGGQYVATAVFDDGCAFTDTVLVTADTELPTVSAGPDAQLNCEVREAELVAQILTGTGPFDYEWTDNGGNVLSTNNSYTATDPGTYFVSVYDQGVNCQSGEDAVQVTDISNEPSTEIYANPGSTLSCVIESIILTTDNEEHVVYSWQTAMGQFDTASIEVTMSDVITLTAFDTISRCSTEVVYEIEEYEEYPVIITEPYPDLNCYNSSVTIDASGSIASNDAMFLWTNPAGDTISQTSTLLTDIAGTYILQLLDGENGCVSYDTFDIEDNTHYLDLSVSEDVTLPCDMNIEVLEVTVLNPQGAVTVEWSTGNGSIIGATDQNQVTVDGPGQYIASVTDITSGCVSMEDVLVSATEDMPSLVLAETYETSCPEVNDGALLITEVVGGTPPYAIEVNGTAMQDSILEDLAPGSYLILVTDFQGCAYDTTVIIEEGVNFNIDLETQATIKPGEEFVLEASVNIPDDEIGTVSWTPSTGLSCDSCLVTTASPNDNQTYVVTVTDIFGCQASATISIRVEIDRQVYIPNTFSPGNGDGINDFFTAYTNQDDAQIVQMEVFDRWGNTVFGKENFDTNVSTLGWDGTFNGQLMNPGVFVYVIEIEFADGFRQIFKGDVTVIR